MTQDPISPKEVYIEMSPPIFSQSLPTMDGACILCNRRCKAEALALSFITVFMLTLIGVAVFTMGGETGKIAGIILFTISGCGCLSACCFCADKFSCCIRVREF